MSKKLIDMLEEMHNTLLYDKKLSSKSYIWLCKILESIKGVFASEEQKIVWHKSKIVVLGQRNVGKTTFFEFLQTQKISNKNYEQTFSSSTKANTIEIEGVKLEILSSLDMGGADYNLELWKKQVEKSNTVFYLFNSKKVMDNDKNHIKKIRSNLKYIGESIRDNKRITKIFLVGTHTDELENGDFYDISQEIFEKNVVQEAIMMLGGRDKCRFVSGSLKDTNSAKKLFSNIVNSDFKK